MYFQMIWNAETQTERTTMQTATPQLTFKIPYALRHLQPEIKNRSGRFNPEDKTWTLDDSESNRALVHQMELPPPRTAAPPEERVKAVAQTATELLSALKIGTYILVEATPLRIVIEKAPTA
jgi:hypothetical protein